MNIPYSAIKGIFDSALNVPTDPSGKLLGRLINNANETQPGLRNACAQVVFIRKIQLYLYGVAAICLLFFLLALLLWKKNHAELEAIMVISTFFGIISSIASFAYQTSKQDVKVFNDFLNSVIKILLAVDTHLNDILTSQPKVEVIRHILRYWKFDELKSSIEYMLKEFEANALKLKDTSEYPSAAFKYNVLLAYVKKLKLSNKDPIPIKADAVKEKALA